MSDIDIRRAIEIVAKCPKCSVERLLPEGWEALMRASLPEDYTWDGILRCRNNHDPEAFVLTPRITCPVCGLTSYNPNDVRERYCGNCHWWTSDPTLGPNRPEEGA